MKKWTGARWPCKQENNMPQSDFKRKALKAGFTEEQADFLDQNVAEFPHTHEISEIDGLEEELAGSEDDSEDDSD
jgi:hypothetical protein